MTLTIHPTAVIDADAELGDGVEVGAYAVIGPGVEVGDGVRLGPHVVLERDVTLGAGVRIAAGAVLGGDPQDVKYRGEPARVTVGPRTVIREHSTVNRGTAATGLTAIGATAS